MAIALVSTSLFCTDKISGIAPTAPWVQATADNPTGSYRFTTNGWEDSSNWRINGEETKVKFIDNIHPLIWTLIVVLVAFGLAILVSDDKNVERLWSKCDPPG